MSAKRTNEKLWEKIKLRVTREDKYGKEDSWNARKAQYAVKLYKELGGTYIGNKSKKNSLVKWTKEDWGYIDDKPGNRYLPLKIRRNLSRKDKISENRRKHVATKKGQSRAKYGKSVLKKFNNLHLQQSHHE